MVALAFAALLAVAPMQVPPPAPQSPPANAPAAAEEPADLGEIEVTGRRLDDMIRSFVGEVADPVPRRGLARWDDRMCVGVANLKAEPAQYIIDRVSSVALELGIVPGEPGCSANLLIIASSDPAGLARTLVSQRGRAFRIGGSGMDQGGAALENFVASTAPVRWWQVSMPTDSATGAWATRIPGECNNACAEAADMAPNIDVFAASRLRTQVVNYIFRTVVILDIDQVSRVSAQQLADYVAMVALAQIDPNAATHEYASILNVFDAPDRVASLTNWDRAYLQGLYAAERTDKNLGAGRSEIVRSIHAAHRQLQAGEDD